MIYTRVWCGDGSIVLVNPSIHPALIIIRPSIDEPTSYEYERYHRSLQTSKQKSLINLIFRASPCRPSWSTTISRKLTVSILMPWLQNWTHRSKPLPNLNSSTPWWLVWSYASTSLIQWVLSLQAQPMTSHIMMQWSRILMSRRYHLARLNSSISFVLVRGFESTLKRWTQRVCIDLAMRSWHLLLKSSQQSSSKPQLLLFAAIKASNTKKQLLLRSTMTTSLWAQ